jgi:hypothetical protein
MSEPFGVRPAELRATSQRLGEVGAAMGGVLSSLRARLAAEGAPWGDDAIGDQFANGPGGYLAQLAWVQGSVDAKTSLLGYYSGQLKTTADSAQAADEA